MELVSIFLSNEKLPRIWNYLAMFCLRFLVGGSADDLFTIVHSFINITMTFVELDVLILNFIWNSKGSRIAKND